MKPFTAIKFLTLASLIVYSGKGFAQGGGPNSGNQTVYNAESSAQAQLTKNLGCTNRLNYQLSKLLPPVAGIDIKPDGSFKNGLPDFTGRSNSPQASAAIDDFNSCLLGINPTPVDSQAKCTKLETEIDAAANDVAKDCAHAPKVSADSIDDGTFATADLAKTNKGGWSVCMQDAVSCRKAETGMNDSADSCADSSLEDLQKNNASADELKSYCQSKYPAQCGPMDRASLRQTAKDMDADLASEVKDLQKSLKDKKDDLQSNKDKNDANDKKQQSFATDAAKQSKALQDQFEAAVKYAKDSEAAKLNKNYEKITADQNIVKAAAFNVTNADAAKFDAQNKFVNLCKAQAKIEANRQYPPGGINYGGMNSLTTKNAKWQQVYIATLQSLYADGTTCDSGNYANVTLALLNSQKAQIQAQADVVKDQADLQTAISKMNMNVDSATYKLVTDQSQKVQELAVQQANDWKTIITNRTKYQKSMADDQTEMTKIQGKIDTAPKKKACIQTIRSCSALAGIPAGNSNNAPEIEKVPNEIAKLKGLCREAATACGMKSKDASIAFFNSIEGYSDLDKTNKIDDSELPFDTSKASCADAIAATIESNPSKLTAIQNARKSSSSGTRSNQSDNTGKK